MRNLLARLVMGLSGWFREHRLKKCIGLLRLRPDDRILDVGGLPGIWLGSGFEQNVTLINLSAPPENRGPFTWIQGDACDMSAIPDQSFDIVFSNSVIEHVGGLERQARMAKEVRRIAKRYWIQTPNRHFPLEVHFFFPFFQYLPAAVRRSVARVWPFSFSKIYGLDAVYEADHIWLLDAKDMSTLFPDATLLRERVVGMTKSLIAYKI